MNAVAGRNGGDPRSTGSILRWMIAVIGVLSLFSCATSAPVARKDAASISGAPDKAAEHLTLAVLPLKNITDVYGENRGIPSPITGKVFITGPVEGEAATFLADLILAHLKETGNQNVLPPARTEGVYEQVLSGNPAFSSDREAAIWMGRRLGVDAVIVGHVFRFRERRGSRLAVETPASVAFDLQMMRTDTGRIVWSVFVDETQAALSDDLFQIGKFFQRQGRWVTAREMAEAALSRMFESFP